MSVHLRYNSWYISMPFSTKQEREMTRFSLGPVHTGPEKFENSALFLRLSLPSTLIRHENWTFSKTLFKPQEFENAGFAF